MPRFVILEHDHPHLHWDLMLDSGAALRTWRLAAPPGEPCNIPATALGDHRKRYLDYEGPVSGNRGVVARWDAGDFCIHDEHADRLVIDLHGSRIRGRWSLKRVAGTDWLFAPLGNA